MRTTLKPPETHAQYYRRKMRDFALFYRAAINPKVSMTLAERGKLGEDALRSALWYRKMWRECEAEK